MAAPIKVGIIGFGLSANCFHLPFILPNPDLEVYAFLQRAPASDAASQRYGHCTVKFPHAKHYQTAEAFFADPLIELVVVAAGNHEVFATAALEAGKHGTSAQADALIALAKAKGKILTVFQNRRLDSDFRTVAHLVQTGALGDVKEAEIHFDPPGAPWVSSYTETEYTPGRGMIFELGTHTIDQALVLFGTPSAVTAFLRSNREGVSAASADAVHDTFTLVLEYDGSAQPNLVVTVKTALVSVLRDQLRFVVRGTRGSFVKFGTCPQEARALAAPGVAADPSYGVEDARTWGTLTTAGAAPVDDAAAAHAGHDAATGYWVGPYPSLPGDYGAYYANLVAAVRGLAPLAVEPETSRAGIRLTELARRSHETRATVPWSETD